MIDYEMVERVEAWFCNIKADVILGKNLHKHLVEVFRQTKNLHTIIQTAERNNEPTSQLYKVLKILADFGNEIIAEIKKKESG